jgi:elongation factor G
MKTYSTEQIRNVVLMGNTKSGKTTLAEAMMMEGKVIDRRGTVEAKNTVCDNTEIEQLYQRSIYPTLFYTEFMDHKLNFIDTPGSDDFIGGLISAFKVADSGVMLINAQQGVEVGTEIFSRYAEQHRKPLILAVNQLDHEKANWETTLDSLHECFGNKVCPLQFPVSTGADFNSFIDVVSMKEYRFTDDNGAFEVVDIPADLKEKADEMHAALAELAAEADESLMEVFFENGGLKPEEIIKGLVIGFQKCEIMPLLVISGKKDIGVKRMLELITLLHRILR